MIADHVAKDAWELKVWHLASPFDLNELPACGDCGDVHRNFYCAVPLRILIPRSDEQPFFIIQITVKVCLYQSISIPCIASIHVCAKTFSLSDSVLLFKDQKSLAALRILHVRYTFNIVHTMTPNVDLAFTDGRAHTSESSNNPFSGDHGDRAHETADVRLPRLIQN